MHVTVKKGFVLSVLRIIRCTRAAGKTYESFHISCSRMAAFNDLRLTPGLLECQLCKFNNVATMADLLRMIINRCLLDGLQYH